MSELHLGALITLSVTLLLIILSSALVAARVWHWVSRHRKLFIERDEDGEIRFGGELRPRAAWAWFPKGASDLQEAMEKERTNGQP